VKKLALQFVCMFLFSIFQARHVYVWNIHLLFANFPSKERLGDLCVLLFYEQGMMRLPKMKVVRTRKVSC